MRTSIFSRLRKRGGPTTYLHVEANDVEIKLIPERGPSLTLTREDAYEHSARSCAPQGRKLFIDAEAGNGKTYLRNDNEPEWHRCVLKNVGEDLNDRRNVQLRFEGLDLPLVINRQQHLLSQDTKQLLVALGRGGELLTKPFMCEEVLKLLRDSVDTKILLREVLGELHVKKYEGFPDATPSFNRKKASLEAAIATATQHIERWQKELADIVASERPVPRIEMTPEEMLLGWVFPVGAKLQRRVNDRRRCECCRKWIEGTTDNVVWPHVSFDGATCHVYAHPLCLFKKAQALRLTGVVRFHGAMYSDGYAILTSAQEEKAHNFYNQLRREGRA